MTGNIPENNQIGRFINADSYACTGQGVVGNNMYAYCLNSPVCLVDSMGNTPTEAVDVNGDGEIEYYRYDYAYRETVYLPYHDQFYTVATSGSVYIFPETEITYFENECNIPNGFNKYTDILVADIVDPIDSSEDAVRAAKTIWIETYGSSLFCFSQTKHPPVSRWVHFSRNLCDFGGCGLYH